MAVLNTPKAFDKGLLETKVKEGIEPFLDYTNATFDQIIRAFPNQLTLAENMRGKGISVQAKHRQPLQISTDRTRPSGIIILKSSSPVRSYSWNTVASGFTEITFSFDEPVPVKTKKYEASSFTVQEPFFGQAGDFIKTSGFGNKANNGSFFIISITGNSAFSIATGGAADETKPTYSGDNESAKTVELFVLF